MVTDDELKMRVTAYHEAGHAIVAVLKSLPVKCISIVPCTGYMGGCKVDSHS